MPPRLPTPSPGSWTVPAAPPASTVLPVPPPPSRPPLLCTTPLPRRRPRNPARRSPKGVAPRDGSKRPPDHPRLPLENLALTPWAGLGWLFQSHPHDRRSSRNPSGGQDLEGAGARPAPTAPPALPLLPLGTLPLPPGPLLRERRGEINAPSCYGARKLPRMLPRAAPSGQPHLPPGDQWTGRRPPSCGLDPSGLLVNP